MRAAVPLQKCKFQSRVGAIADSWRALNKWFDSSRDFGFSNTIILPCSCHPQAAVSRRTLWCIAASFTKGLEVARQETKPLARISHGQEAVRIEVI